MVKVTVAETIGGNCDIVYADGPNLYAQVGACWDANAVTGDVLIAEVEVTDDELTRLIELVRQEKDDEVIRYLLRKAGVDYEI